MRPGNFQEALACWAGRDDMGGFRTAGAMLFPAWKAGRTCRAPHRKDRSPSFSIYRSPADVWRFKDHATGEQGGLFGFVMLSGMDARATAGWLRENGSLSFLPPDSPVHRPLAHAWQPYQMNSQEFTRCMTMAQVLSTDDVSIHRFAAARGWKERTIRRLAMDYELGIDGDRLVMIYPTGAKLRLKPLENAQTAQWHGAKFLWIAGKPDSLLRGERITKSTECVHITEGETDAISLIDAGYDTGWQERVVAVPGASCWRDEWREQFHGIRVVLWPDSDQAGERLTQRIVDSLGSVAGKIEIVQRGEANNSEHTTINQAKEEPACI